MRSRTWLGLRPDESFTLKSRSGQPIYGNFFGQSSFSRLAIVNKSCLIKVPQETDIKQFAPLGCGVQTGYGVVVNKLNLQPGDSFIVSGCGAVGLSAIMAAKARGAKTIIAVDLQEPRLAIAKEVGATHVVNGASKDLIEEIRAIAPLPVGVKYALDTTAVPKVIEDMIEAVGVQGKVVIVGATPPDKFVQIQPLKFLDAGKQLLGCVGGESYPAEVSKDF
jgi:Zn-dependent alcohol dehydrogenase